MMHSKCTDARLINILGVVFDSQVNFDKCNDSICCKDNRLVNGMKGIVMGTAKRLTEYLGDGAITKYPIR